MAEIVLRVSHNVEIAHRLTLIPGKCENIHGHSLWITLQLSTLTDESGYALGPDGTPLEFGAAKKLFRAYLDKEWDHHLHLNEDDPWAQQLRPVDMGNFAERLPGLVTHPGDPSTENIARWIHEWACDNFKGLQLIVDIRETQSNGVEFFG
jgi:6-pyruvoyl-tetrahydropterin synthase